MVTQNPHYYYGKFDRLRALSTHTDRDQTVIMLVVAAGRRLHQLEDNMRQELIEALTYPRLLVKRLIEEHNYQHESLFAATGERCNHCTGENCGWETCFQDFRKFEEMPIDSLAASLREGIKLVESLYSELHHDETTCTCESCNWVRNAEHLTEECEHHLPHVESALQAQAHESS